MQDISGGEIALYVANECRMPLYTILQVPKIYLKSKIVLKVFLKNQYGHIHLELNHERKREEAPELLSTQESDATAH